MSEATGRRKPRATAGARRAGSKPPATTDAAPGNTRPSLSAVSSRDLLEVVCNNTTSALFIMDERQHCVFMNAAAEALTGYTLDEVRGKSLHDAIHHTHPDGRPYPLSDCPIDQAFPTNNQERGEEVFVHRDGHFYPVAFTASPVRDSAGTPIGTVIEVQDISERQQKQREAVASQEYLRSAIDSSAGGFYGVDSEGVTTVCNASFLRLLGFARHEDAVGRKLHDVIHHTHPDGTHYPKEECPIYTAASTGRPAHVEEELFFRLDGTSFPVEYWTQPTLRDGVVTGAVTTFIDLTERKAAERALRDAHARLDAALNAGEIGTFVWDIVNDRLYGDRNFAVLFAIHLDPDGAAPLQAFVDVIHAEDRPKVLALIKQTLETGCDYTAEYRIVSGAGVRWVIARGKVEHDTDGRAVRFPGMVLDLTERKSAEEALRQGKELLEVALSASATGTFRLDLATREFIDFDHNLKRLFGLDPARPVRTLEDCFSVVHAEDASRVHAALERTLREGVDFELEFRVVHPDGSIHWLFDRAKVTRNVHGAPAYLVGATTDVTLRRLSEGAAREATERFRFLAETLPQKIFTAHPTGEADYLNEQWADYTGLPLAALQGWGWTRLVHPEDAQASAEIWRRGVQEGQPFEVEHRVCRHDGEYHWHLSRVHPMRDASGGVAMWIGSVTDIDEFIRTRDALRASARDREALLDAERAARAQAEAASRLKDEFLATLSHELRTPLNAILGWSQLLRHTPDDAARVIEGLAVIERNTRVQVKLVEDLLDMSRVVSGKLRLEVQRVDLAEVIQTAVESVTPAAQAKGIRIVPVLSTHVGLVRGDPARLQQVFWNLLSNAIKFTPKGGKVQVGLHRVNSHCEVTVTDTGMGIEPAFLPHVFDRFRQADGAITRTHLGLGLGLAIVKSILELHGATVRAQSPGLGLGTTFTVELPLMVVHDAPIPAPAPASPEASELPDPLGHEDRQMLDSVRVLVVDDDRDARDLVRRVLEDSSATVRTAATAEEALEMLRREPPHVLVSDIGMPGEDGYSLIRRVRELPAREGGGTPAVALTAFARSEDRRQALLAGFHAHIAKPVEPPELVTVVASLAGRIGTRRE